VATTPDGEFALAAMAQSLDNYRYILGSLGLHDTIRLQLRRDGEVRLGAGLVAGSVGVVDIFHTCSFK
jgi:hypothetical protein